MRGICIKNTNPTLNLALEEILLEELLQSTNSQNSHTGFFLLWHNSPSIIVGRHQHTDQEVNGDLIKTYDLPVVRRITGGGTVYHDLGNLNFSFIVPANTVPQMEKGMNFQYFMQPILQALQSLGIGAQFNSRNDLVCEGRKFSGSAQMRRHNAILHHGTLMVHLDLEMLGAVLTGSPDKYKSKGIASVRSRVINLEEVSGASVSMEKLKSALLTQCATSVIDVAAAGEDIFARAEALAERKYRTHQWNYGASPPFTEKRRERFAWGLVECHMDVVKGRIEGVKICGDFFAEEEVETLEGQLLHVAYTPEAVGAALAECAMGKYFYGCDEEKMRQFFCRF